MNKDNKENLIVLIGFLESGKTTFLKELTSNLIEKEYDPFIILNDYQNALLDIQWFSDKLTNNNAKALTGSCICCDGLNQLRDILNSPPARNRPLTIIEANGTTDSIDLMSHLSIGVHENYNPPIQISLVNAKTWQQKSQYNELESQQVQTASIILISHEDLVDKQRLEEVREQLRFLNPHAMILEKGLFKFEDILNSDSPAKDMTLRKHSHEKSHWSSCQIDLPEVIEEDQLRSFLQAIPDSIIRIKGCTKLAHNSEHFIYFERYLDKQISIRPFPGTPSFGAKLIAIGPGSEPLNLKNLCNKFIY